MALTLFGRLTLLLTGALMTSALHAASADRPPADPIAAIVSASPSMAPWSINPFLPLPRRLTDGSLLTWDDMAVLNGTDAGTDAPTFTLVWKAKSPRPVVREAPVRHQPVFSMIEPLRGPGTGGAPVSRWLSGALDAPRALFFFDAPPAISVAAIQPVPEASTWALMVAGLGVVVLFTRRRRVVAYRVPMTPTAAT